MVQLSTLPLPSSSRILSYLRLRGSFVRSRQSRESTFAIFTELSVKSREVAIKLTLKKKRDGVINFLLAWHSLSIFLSVFSSSSFCRGAYCKPTLEPKRVSHRSFFSCSETTLHAPL